MSMIGPLGEIEVVARESAGHAPVRAERDAAGDAKHAAGGGSERVGHRHGSAAVRERERGADHALSVSGVKDLQRCAVLELRV